jgi:hypothetical protein
VEGHEPQITIQGGLVRPDAVVRFSLCSSRSELLSYASWARRRMSQNERRRKRRRGGKRSHRSCLRLSSPSSSSTKSRSDPFFTGLPRSRISPGSPAPAYDQADRAESRCRDSTLAVRDSSREDRNAFLVSYASSRFALSSSGRDGLSSSSSSSSTATPAFQQS